jgi:hypothetical protein
MPDFTVQTYKKVLNTLQQQGFSFLSVNEFISGVEGKAIILRHDVDALPGNSLEFARIQAELGFRGTYYFRIVTESFDEKIIKQIFELGHEVGYHYEDVSLSSERQKIKVKRQKGREQGSGLRAQEVEVGSRKYVVSSKEEEYEECLAGIAIESFKENLERLRQIVPVKTICMHGSPMSRWDSRLLWKYYDYRDFGIIGEPYFDINFDEVLYLTDTGRRWDGGAVSIRDNATKKMDLETKRQRDEETQSLSPSVSQSLSPSVHSAPCSLLPAPRPKFHSTFDIIKAARAGKLPDKIMMTFHPQRWTDKPVPWVNELVWQNVKNVGKWVLVKAGKR